MTNNQHKQSDFFKGMGTGESDRSNYGYNPTIDRRMAEVANNQAVYGYGAKHAEPPISRDSQPGNVYLMLGILRGFRVKAKIGLSRKRERRLQEVRKDHGRFIFIVFVISTSNMIRLEQAAHRHFKAYKEPEIEGTGRTEFFRINPIRLIKMIWFLFMKEKSFQCFDRLKSFKNAFNFGKRRL